MEVIHKIKMDLSRPSGFSRLHAVQGDTDTRKVEMTLLCGGVPWEVPGDANLAVRYRHAGGTGGIYDTLPDGAAACTASGNVVTMTLAPAVLSAAGEVEVQLEMEQSGDYLASFCFHVIVHADPSVGAQTPETYVNLQRWILGELSSGKYNGADGKSAYEYAQDGGYEGTEAEFAKKLAFNQATPEMFGAKGDGVTDDAAAITAALASARYVQFDGNKTYAVGSTIVIPADAHVDFCGATVVPMGNHDVIRVMPGSYIENLIVRCTDVAGWDSSGMVFYGGDMFRASNPTRINNVKMHNDVTFNDGVANTGNGFYLYADAAKQFIEGIAISDISTCGFGKGIYIDGVDNDVEVESEAERVFIGANNFNRYWSFRDTYGIYIDGPLPNNVTTNNFFEELNVQSDYYGGSIYAIYCNGINNYFSGCLYDYSILYYHPKTAVYFDGGAQNVVEVTAGEINFPEYCVNLGAHTNKVIKHSYTNDFHAPYTSSEPSMLGSQDDALAFINERADCTLESLDIEPMVGDISSVFNPTPTKTLIYQTMNPDTQECRAIITINLKTVIGDLAHFILQFGRWTAPKSVKVTCYTADEVIVLCQTTNNRNRSIIITPSFDRSPLSSRHHFDKVKDVAKLVVELGGINFTGTRADGTVYGEWELVRIMAVDSYNTGNTWLRRDGGEVYGNIKFAENNGVVLASADGKKYLLTVSSDGMLGTTEWTEQEEEAPEVAVLTPTMAAGASWYDTELAGAEQNTITSVAFNAAYEPTGSEDASWACDEDGNGNIMAYRNGSDVVIKSTTGSEQIKLNTDSSYMFANDGTNANFSALANITGTEMWVASKNTNISALLRGNSLITEPVCIPEGVTNISRAFDNCVALIHAPVIPEGVTALSNAFIRCLALTEMPNIPTTAKDLAYFVGNCRKITTVDVVIPASVTKLNNAFWNCVVLNGNIEVNATDLTSYADCFLNASSTSGAIVLTGSCPLLAELAATNTQGKVTVATA